MFRFNTIVTVAVAAAGLMAFGSAVQAQNSAKSVWDGVFSEEQANRGAGVYQQRCGACHGVSMNGTGEAPALIGGEFISHYDQLSVGDLFERVRVTMPQNDPGVLSRDQYADVVAYLLRENGFPVGAAALDKRTEVLETIAFTAQKPDKQAGR